MLSFFDFPSKIDTMNTLSRKQREIAERHALLLDIGRRLIDTEGYRTLSMDRIAEIAEYSKGTVYQHFSCKEEVLIQLCNHNSIGLKAFFERAKSWDGSSREKMLAIFVAHELWAALNPTCFEHTQTLCGGGTKEKVSAESLKTHNRLEFEIVGLIGSIVEEAVKNKELPADSTLTVPELVFSLWSICFGSLQLRSLNLPLKEMGVNNPKDATLLAIDAMLDGIGWQPLSGKHDYTLVKSKINKTLFAEENKQLRQQHKQT